jgi:hypothetical protein
MATHSKSMSIPSNPVGQGAGLSRILRNHISLTQRARLIEYMVKTKWRGF